MSFNEIQQKVFELIKNQDQTVVDHFVLAKSVDDYKGDIPAYFRKCKVAFLSNFTLQGLPEVFRTRALFNNLFVSTYLAPYNQYAQEILNTGSSLYEFDPKIIYLVIDSADSDSRQIIELISFLIEKTKFNIVVAYDGVLENMSDNNRVLFFSMRDFLNKIGRDQYWYTKYKDLGDLRFSPDGFPLLADELIGFTVAVNGSTKKCLVLDLDNTLWKGIIGEDGYDNIVPDRKLQKYILKLQERGVILAINSKNNAEDALNVIENHPDNILRKKHFSAWRINWQDKSSNIKELAKELNLGMDSFVFVDDDPFQQNSVKSTFPDVAVLPPELLKNYPGFTALSVTTEDIKRGQMYAEEKQRQEFQESLGSVDDFLKQLNLEIKIKPADEQIIPRIAQLTQKTNQFNLTTRRYNEEDINNLLDKNWKVWYVEAKDRFGDYGVIGLAIVEPSELSWRIDNFLMSCRILGRGIENAFLTFLLKKAGEKNAECMIGEFIPTDKNKPCQTFYKDNGFCLNESNKEVDVYKIDIKNAKENFPDFIKIDII